LGEFEFEFPTPLNTMKQQLNPLARRAPFAALSALCLSAAFLSSCVTQEKYDDTQLSAKHYQNRTIELEGRVSSLEDENRRLRAQLEAAENNPVEAGYSAQDFDARIANLRNVLAELGQAPGDVTKFAVDGGYVYRVKDSVLFGLGSADVSAEGKRVLTEVATDIKSRPHGKVFVRGHTDDLPIVKPETKAKFPHGNIDLSAERAVSVGALLAASSVPESRIVVMGFGSADPVAPNNSDENRRKNRRVDIFVQDAQAASGAGN